MARRTAVLVTLAVALALVATGVSTLRTTTAAAMAPAPTVGAVSYAWPVRGTPDVVHPFAAPPQPWAPGHRGVDLSARAGEPVLAPAAGVVTFAGVVVDRGVVTIAHADGRRSSLEPVVASVRAGERVRAHAPVGTLAATGSHCAPAPCLHWGVRRGARYVDPLGLLPGAGPIVLLPVGADDRSGTGRFD